MFIEKYDEKKDEKEYDSFIQKIIFEEDIELAEEKVGVNDGLLLEDDGRPEIICQI